MYREFMIKDLCFLIVFKYFTKHVCMCDVKYAILSNGKTTFLRSLTQYSHTLKTL